MWLIIILIVMFVIMLLLHKLHSVEIKQITERLWELEDTVGMQTDYTADRSDADKEQERGEVS